MRAWKVRRPVDNTYKYVITENLMRATEKNALTKICFLHFYEYYFSQPTVDRGADNARVMYWYHRQFIEAAEDRYCNEPAINERLHGALADFFAGTWAEGRNLICLGGCCCSCSFGLYRMPTQQ